MFGAGIFSNPTCLSSPAEAFWASAGAAPRRSGQKVGKQCGGRAWGQLWEKQSTQRKRPVPTPDRTFIWKWEELGLKIARRL